MSIDAAIREKGLLIDLETRSEITEARLSELKLAAISKVGEDQMVIFGPDDSFLNRFAALLKIPGPLPLACPDAEFSPVYVGDVAAAFANALEDRNTFGHHYELCGPKSYTLEELVRFVAYHSGRYKSIVRLPDWAARLQASILQYFPGQPFTPDNYLSLQKPSVCSQDGLGLLGVTATSLENTAPRFLGHGGKSGRLDRLRRISQR